MTSRYDKIQYTNYLHPGPSETAPPEFIGNGNYIDDLFRQPLDKYKAKPRSGGETPGKVVRVIKNGKLEPFGPRSKLQAVAEVESTTCLKLIVYCPEFDQFKMLPKNWVNPGEDEDLVSNLCVFEAQNDKIDKQIPSVGDDVKVIYPWHGPDGWTSKVGVYLGKIASGDAVTYTPTKDYFNKNNGHGRKKNVPQV